MTDTKYILGNIVRVTASFKDSDGILRDPAEVNFQLKLPDATIKDYTYGETPDIVKVDVGIYYMDVSLTLAGKYSYYFYSLGLGQAADQASFMVAGKLT